jgi:hypothetical protein
MPEQKPTAANSEAALQARVAALEAEIAQLRPIVAAAREALAVFEGRRPGFAAPYARDLLRAAFANDSLALSHPTVPRWKRGKSPKRQKRAVVPR